MFIKTTLLIGLIMFMQTVTANATPKLATATFAGGCFWCMEPAFEKFSGVISVISGYMGGTKLDPTYAEVSSGQTNYREVVQVVYDPQKVSYEQLLEVFWRQIDPTDNGGQFVDRGKQYRSAIFYHDQEQKQLAEQSKEKLIKDQLFSKPIVTEILPATKFYQAEKYHQDYYKKNPLRYKFYRHNSGRDKFLEKTWKKRTYYGDKLTILQYQVTQENATEPAFDNAYWDNKRDGIYVDIISGEPLFSSNDKYVSGTGWPSFSKPLEMTNIVLKKELSFLLLRTEVRSKLANSHLGHVFNDKKSYTGKRYCINSAALYFIPKEDLEKSGYGKYKKLFINSDKDK